MYTILRRACRITLLTYACPRIIVRRPQVIFYYHYAYLIADLAEIAKQLMVVGLAVGQAFPLVVPVYQDNQVFLKSSTFVFGRNYFPALF